MRGAPFRGDAGGKWGGKKGVLLSTSFPWRRKGEVRDGAGGVK